MKYSLAVYYCDGSSSMVEFEKPPGAHPESGLSLRACLAQAEVTGKVVQRIGKPVSFGAVFDLWSLTRDEILPRSDAHLHSEIKAAKP